MKEELKELIDFTLPGDSTQFLYLDELVLESKYISTLKPNPFHLKLFYRKTSHRIEQPKASVCIAHGFGEHSGRYRSFAAFLAKRNFEVHTLDYRNYTKTTGIRGARAAHDLDEMQEDLTNFLCRCVRHCLVLSTEIRWEGFWWPLY